MESIDQERSAQAIQVHLGILQSVITRMAANSSACKAYCITLVSAVLVIVADKGKPQYAFIAVIPILLFFSLDSYYLALETKFRSSYNDFIGKYHAKSLKVEDLFSVAPSKLTIIQTWKVLKSFSIWPFYTVLLGMAIVAWRVVIPPTMTLPALPTKVEVISLPSKIELVSEKPIPPATEAVGSSNAKIISKQHRFRSAKK